MDKKNCRKAANPSPLLSLLGRAQIPPLHARSREAQQEPKPSQTTPLSLPVGPAWQHRQGASRPCHLPSSLPRDSASPGDRASPSIPATPCHTRHAAKAIKSPPLPLHFPSSSPLFRAARTLKFLAGARHSRHRIFSTPVSRDHPSPPIWLIPLPHTLAHP